jgi:hypothetical protein
VRARDRTLLAENLRRVYGAESPVEALGDEGEGSGRSDQKNANRPPRTPPSPARPPTAASKGPRRPGKRGVVEKDCPPSPPAFSGLSGRVLGEASRGFCRPGGPPPQGAPPGPGPRGKGVSGPACPSPIPARLGSPGSGGRSIFQTAGLTESGTSRVPDSRSYRLCNLQTYRLCNFRTHVVC